MAEGCATCRELRSAAISLVARRGIHAVTHRDVAAAAGVELDRAAEHYPTLDHCLAAALEEGSEHFRAATERALDQEGTWQERLRAATLAMVEEFDLHPELARFCVVEAPRSDLLRLRGARLAARRRYLRLMLSHFDHADDAMSEVGMEVLVGAGHHVAREGLERGDGFAMLDAMDRLVGAFDPAKV
jgi:AcrR family transcriptional regulator